MEYQEINTDEIEICYLEDQDSFLFVATSTRDFANLSEALLVFRKAYISASTDEFNSLCEETQYNTFASEMEPFPTEEIINNNWYNLAVESWGSEAPKWMHNLYNSNKYLSHISYRDVLHEGIYDSVTKLDNHCIYWCYG